MLYTRDLHSLACSPLTSEYNPDDDDDDDYDDDDDDDEEEEEDGDHDDHDDDDDGYDDDNDDDDDDDDVDDAISFHGCAQLMCWKEHIYSNNLSCAKYLVILSMYTCKITTSYRTHMLHVTYICHKFTPNVGTYSLHGASG